MMSCPLPPSLPDGLETESLTKLEAACLGQMHGQQLSPSAKVTGMCILSGSSYGCLGFKLRSSHLCSSPHTDTLNHLSPLLLCSYFIRLVFPLVIIYCASLWVFQKYFTLFSLWFFSYLLKFTLNILIFNYLQIADAPYFAL